MCRKSQLRGWCGVCFGLGLVLGHCLESWFFCVFGGLGLVALGFCLMNHR